MALLDPGEREAVGAHAIGEPAKGAGEGIRDRPRFVGKEPLGEFAPGCDASAFDQRRTDTAEHHRPRPGFDRYQPGRDQRTHRVADDVDLVDTEMVEQRLRVARHRVGRVRIRVVRLPRLSVPTRVVRDLGAVERGQALHAMILHAR